MKGKKRKSNRELRKLTEKARINRNSFRFCNTTAEKSKEILSEISQLLNEAGVKGDVDMIITPCLYDIILRIKYLLFDVEALRRENTQLRNLIGDKESNS